ncbi:hypothetical protein ACRQET_09175 [Actinotignum sp. GS-2025c]|uniref:hypothetical protein n=1 Tax=Actinotignum sp. GS-2025c TaxID=3427276 RepID=UPI003F46E947
MAGSASGEPYCRPVTKLAKYVCEHGDPEVLFGQGKGQGLGVGIGEEGDVWDLIYTVSSAHLSGVLLPEDLLSDAIYEISRQLDHVSSRVLNDRLELIGSSLRVPRIPRDE